MTSKADANRQADRIAEGRRLRDHIAVARRLADEATAAGRYSEASQWLAVVVFLSDVLDNTFG